jgi:hypothetical protein
MYNKVMDEPNLDLAELMKTDDFEPTETPFGNPIGEIPMGTLAEVAGAEKAREVFARIEEQRQSNNRALARMGLHHLAR